MTTDAFEPRDAVARLEERIEQLAATIESCRKLILAGRIAVALGGVLLAALVVGAIPFNPVAMATAIAAVLCGIVLQGSNRSTAAEAAAQLDAAEAERAALIGAIPLHVVEGGRTLH